jgi:hypothetical protein
MIYIVVTVSIGKPFITGIAGKNHIAAGCKNILSRTSPPLSAVAAGVENFIDNQKNTPTWRIQLCLIADAMLYVRFGWVVYFKSVISLIMLRHAGLLSSVVLLASPPSARSSPTSSYDRLCFHVLQQ